MKCCGSPTTSTAAEAAAPPRPAALLDAVLFSQILKPLAAALGPVGDVALEPVAQSVFVRPAK